MQYCNIAKLKVWYKMCIDLVTLKKWYKPKVGNSEDSVESTLDDGTTVVSQWHWQSEHKSEFKICAGEFTVTFDLVKLVSFVLNCFVVVVLIVLVVLAEVEVMIVVVSKKKNNNTNQQSMLLKITFYKFDLFNKKIQSSYLSK